MSLLEKIFGNYSDKEIKKIRPIVAKINDLEDSISPLSDEELRGKTDEFKDRLSKGETLDDILPEAFAVVREAAKRVLGMRHFDVQLIGGIVLHQGRIAEMKTGEGKTLVSTCPAYLNALTGNGVHIVTVNDYLAKRDAEWMGKVHEFLGLKVGVILHDLEKVERQEAYACDITYGTNNELGFDYLRDNMVVYEKDIVQRGLPYAIIDEVDSVLIDEARTPLIISGQSAKSTQLYERANSFVQTLTKGRVLNEDDALNPLMKEEIKEEGDFVVDEKAKTTSLTQEGVAKAEKFFGLENLSDPENMQYQHHINNALKANFNMTLDRDYVVKDGEVVIVDTFTGRMMPGRRYSDGLHQAIEAKEHVEVQRESKTLATITFQNFFNKYAKKAGMTGTAQTEEAEFRAIYNMDVVCIPTNKPVARVDHSDVVYQTEAAKFRAVVEDVKKSYEKGQPVLVGTVNIEISEKLSSMLKKEGIKHQVLNAKYHEKEAEIVALAGEKGAITIATNMAGRGTDIKLGEGVVELGGLKIIGTERHESRRIDNQLRGRSGRQGDVGESRFYLSLEDDLMRIFGSEKTAALIARMGLPEDEPIEAKLLSRAIENAQKKVEENNFSARKRLLDYDQVMNEQREIIYDERHKVLVGENLKEDILGMVKNVITRICDANCPDADDPTEWDMAEINHQLRPIFEMGDYELDEDDKQKLTKAGLIERIYEDAEEKYNERESENPEELYRELERVITLRVVDSKWMDHIDDMDQMRQGISLRSYGQRDPLVEYQFISYDMFEELNRNIQEEIVKSMYHVRIVTPEAPQREQVANPTSTNADTSGVNRTKVRKEEKVGRNDPCPCGSGKKYKNCCGKNA